MVEYVTKQTVIDELSRYGMTEDGEAIINAIPAADVVEVRHGKWIWLEVDDDDFETDIVTCSYCGKSYETRFSKKSFFETFKFCHNCGAKMDGGQDDANN